MIHETFEAIELGEAEALIEMWLPESQEELVEKYVPGAAAYVEFE